LSQTSVLIAARPSADDANGAVFRTVRVEVVPAEPRLFPPRDNNTPPVCGFTTQPGCVATGSCQVPTGFQILFQSTANDPDGRIVRYEWSFGDGTGDLKPDTNHAYAKQDTFTVRHFVTDNNGAIMACPALSITVKD
jgi:PKD repeat protein